MKKIISILLVTVMLLSMAVGLTVGVGADVVAQPTTEQPKFTAQNAKIQAGTEYPNTFYIYDAEDFAAFTEFTNCDGNDTGEFASKYSYGANVNGSGVPLTVILMNDIVLNDTDDTAWKTKTGITEVYSIYAWNGSAHFDGNGKTIEGLAVKKYEGNPAVRPGIGLFARLNAQGANKVVENLTIKGFYTVNDISEGETAKTSSRGVGALVGFVTNITAGNSVTIRNCHVIDAEFAISVASEEENKNCGFVYGGLIGEIRANGNGGGAVAGSVTIENCTASSKFDSGLGNASAGTLVGRIEDGVNVKTGGADLRSKVTVTNCYASSSTVSSNGKGFLMCGNDCKAADGLNPSESWTNAGLVGYQQNEQTPSSIRLIMGIKNDAFLTQFSEVGFVISDGTKSLTLTGTTVYTHITTSVGELSAEDLAFDYVAAGVVTDMVDGTYTVQCIGIEADGGATVNIGAPVAINLTVAPSVSE